MFCSRIIVLLVFSLAYSNGYATDYSDTLSTQTAPSESLELVGVPLDFGHNLTLTLQRIERDKEVSSMATLYFELTLPKRSTIHAYDPGIELLEGMSQLWHIKSTFHPRWKYSQYKQKVWFLTLKVNSINPKAKDLRFLIVRLHYRKRIAGKKLQKADFSFDEPIPLR